MTQAPTSPAVVVEEDPEVSPQWSAVVAGLVAVLGVAAVVGSLRLGFWTSLGPGPGFFPLCLGVVLAVLSTVWLVRSVRELRAAAPAEPLDRDGVPAAAEPDVLVDDDAFSWRTVAAVLGSLMLLASVLELLGYQLAMLLFLLFHLKVLGRRGWLLTVVLSVGGSIGVFVVFTRLLTVTLPASSVPFLAGLGL